jgi:hypothetical protein
MDAAESITACQPIASQQVLELLTGLVNKSLAAVEHKPAGEARYRMLETVRSRMREKLAESGELAQISNRHLAYYVELVEAVEPHLTEPSQTGWLVRLEQESDNLRLALACSLESSQAEAGLRLAGALWRYWWITGRMIEGCDWCAAVLEMAETEPSLERSAWKAKSLLAHGFLLTILGEWNLAFPILETSLGQFREMNDAQGSGAALCLMGITQSDPHQAYDYFDEGLRYSYQAEDGWWIAFNKH